jgi:DNA-binding beta-propeller fold protein YncE
MHDPVLNTGDYPPEIGTIIITKCAVDGCHNTLSAPMSEGVDLSSWESMMNGRDLGATIIPYSYSQSLIFLYINTFPDLGAIVQPTMPKNAEPLSRNDVLKIRFWINAGAPNKDGFIKWSDLPNRRKYYIANRGCDLISSIDPTTSLVMRYIDVGHVFEIENPSVVRVAPDNLHWYVSFNNSDIIQEFSTTTDQKTGELILGSGNWSSLCISSDSKTAFLLNSDSLQSELAIVDLQNMKLIKKYSNVFMSSATSLAFDETDHILYAGSEHGNFIYKIDVSNPLIANFEIVPLHQVEPPDINAKDNPRSLYFDITKSRLYVACNGSGLFNEYNVKTNQLLSSIHVGNTPANIAYDPNHDLFFVACTNDSITLPGFHGYVTIVDGTSLAVIDKIHTDIQPYGLAVDSQLNRLIVANRNAIDSGPPPHHHVECVGRVGSFSYIDLNTLSLINEEGFYLSVEPYSVSIKN